MSVITNHGPTLDKSQCRYCLKKWPCRAADTALLEACREELLNQWECNHSEHCTNILPCPVASCNWPKPEAIARLDERLEAK